ncbi:MAG: hypothetical protein R2747_14230 [Pyrinomonadaceae bacterium]
MKNFKTTYLKKIATALTLILSLLTLSLPAADKMKPEEVIAKHLESIGTPEARAAMKSVTIVGTAKATFFGRGGGVAEGISVVASEGDKYLVAMKFNNPDYQFEKMGFDAENFTVGYVRPGQRTALGRILQDNRGTFERGIMSGVLSTSWELLNVDENEAKIKYSGMGKIDGKKYHELSYNPKKGSDMSISLFFDPDTFRHVRTEYKRVISSGQGTGVDASARLSETRQKLIEDYSDFGAENNLTLPHTYRIYLEEISGNGTRSYEWLMNLQKFDFNNDIEDSEFKVDAY